MFFGIAMQGPPGARFTLTEIIHDYDVAKNESTLRVPEAQLATPKDRYHSLSYSIYYSFPGHVPSPPTDVKFELVTVVKARQLNTDLYVVFVVDGKEIHYSSNRSAIKDPVPGKPWIGERMVFLIPRDDFMKMAKAKKLGVKLGGVSFDFTEDARMAVGAMAATIKN